MKCRVTLKLGAFVSRDDAMPGKRELLLEKETVFELLIQDLRAFPWQGSSCLSNPLITGQY